MHRSRRRPPAIVLVLAAAVLGSACVQAEGGARIVDRGTTTTTTTTGPGTTTSSEVADDQEAVGELTAWEPCGDGVECASLTVPLDWERPDGDAIEVAVGRVPARGDKIGSLLLNPGGPGSGGVDLLDLFADALPGELSDRFDLVSWDPRGTTGTIPVECRTDAQLRGPDPDPTLGSPAEVAAYQAWAEGFLEGCTTDAGEVLPFISTWDTVRDLDALRAALGDERLTFVGYSYGSLLGTEYLRAFPDRSRAVVLDGIALAAGPVDAVEGQLAGVEQVLGTYLRSCGRRASCRWVGADDATPVLRALIARVEGGDHLDTDSGRPLGPGEMYTGIVQALYSESLWPELDQALSMATDGDGSGLLVLRDLYMGLEDDGTYANAIDAFMAITCADQAERGDDFDGDDQLRADWGARYPLLGELFAVGVPGCHGFPAARHPLTPVGPGQVKPDRPVVVIGNTEDGITPYVQAEELSRAIIGSVLVTYDSADHTAFTISAPRCLTEPVTRFLVDGTRPADGIRC